MTFDPQSARAVAFVDALLAEIEGLDARAYAEVGVPTFLVAEDLTIDAPAPSSVGASDRLGASFAQLAGALVSRKPQLDVEDVGKLIEVFADHNFPTYGGNVLNYRPEAADFLSFSPGQLPPGGAPALLADLVAGMATARAIRAVNFHASPRYREVEYRQQIAAYAQVYEPITADNFAAVVDGAWPHARPGLLPMLFEGYRDNLDVLLPILEEHGLTGWFFVPTAFLTVPVVQQRSYADSHDLHLPVHDEYLGDRIALTWDEMRDISRRGHVIACHSRNHSELGADMPIAVLQDEIVVAKAEMEDELGHEVDIFCWQEGAAIGVNPDADMLLHDAGFRYLISGFKIQKLR